MDEILHQIEAMVETAVCWCLQGNHQKPGFLKVVRTEFVHPQYVLLVVTCVVNTRSCCVSWVTSLGVGNEPEGDLRKKEEETTTGHSDSFLAEHQQLLFTVDEKYPADNSNFGV